MCGNPFSLIKVDVVYRGEIYEADYHSFAYISPMISFIIVWTFCCLSTGRDKI